MALANLAATQSQAGASRGEGLRLHLGDCMELLRDLPDNSVDSAVIDPPYGLGKRPDPRVVLSAWMAGEEPDLGGGGGFMGAAWDRFVPSPMLWAEVCRVLKPGAHVVAFAATRTVQWMGLSMELGGFEPRDVIHWCYWSGFAKGPDLGKLFDRRAGAEREVLGVAHPDGVERPGLGYKGAADVAVLRTAPATDLARTWDGWRTCLKPAIEPALLMRKPLPGTVIDCVERWGTGALNGKGCAFAPGDPMWPGPNGGDDRSRPGNAFRGLVYGDGVEGRSAPDAEGRQAANLLYCPKPSTAERERGTASLPVRSAQECTGRDPDSAGAQTPFAGAGRQSEGRRNHHPTVKPVALTRYLARLVTPPGGTMLTPFAGSGSEAIGAALEGFGVIAAEREPDFHAIASARLAHAIAYPEAWGDTVHGGVSLTEREVLEALGQQGMF